MVHVAGDWNLRRVVQLDREINVLCQVVHVAGDWNLRHVVQLDGD